MNTRWALCATLVCAGCAGSMARLDAAPDADATAAETTPGPSPCASAAQSALAGRVLDFYWWDDDPAPPALALSLAALPASCRELVASAPWITLGGRDAERTVAPRTDGLEAGLHLGTVALRDGEGAELASASVRLRVLRRPPAGAARRVLVVGMDGTRSDALRAATMPVLGFLQRRALATFTAHTQSTAPAVSAPGWMSQFTGVEPMKHGVVANGDYSHRDATFPTWVRRLGTAGRHAVVSSAWQELAEQIIEPGPHVEAYYGPDAISVRRLAQMLPRATAEAYFQHLDAPDSAGHATGFSPANPRYMAAIESCDVRIATLLDGVLARPTFAREDWLFVFTTDHGGNGADHGARDPENQTIWLVLSGASLTRAALPAAGVTHMDAAPTVLRWLGVDVDPAWGFDGTSRVP